MIILTERLKAMADSVEPNESVADIGTDHGYLPLFLYENRSGTSPKLVLTDVSKGSLAKAQDNCKRLFPKDFEAGRFDLRLGDGIDVLEYGEVDCVVIAGMGGLLMIDIMDWDIAKTLSFKKFVLQPRNNGGALRRYLYEKGIAVEKLLIVPEERRFCEIMVCRTPENPGPFVSSEEIDDLIFDYPDMLLDNTGSNSLEYLLNSKEQETRIIDNILAGNNEPDLTESVSNAVEYRKSRIARIDELISRLEAEQR